MRFQDHSQFGESMGIPRKKSFLWQSRSDSFCHTLEESQRIVSNARHGHAIMSLQSSNVFQSRFHILLLVVKVIKAPVVVSVLLRKAGFCDKSRNRLSGQSSLYFS